LNKDRLRTYSEKSGIPLKEIEERYNTFYKEFGSVSKSLRKLKGEIQRDSGSLRSTALMWKGFFFGDTATIDFVELMKRRATSLYNNPEMRDWAMKQNIVAPDGTPLDTRKQVDFKDNPRYLQELQGHAYSRKMYGIAGQGKDFTNPKFFLMNFTNDVAEKDFQYEWYRMGMFRGTLGKTDLNMYKINAKSVTKFKVVDDIPLEKKAELIRNCGYKIYKVSEIEKAFAMNKDSKRDDRTDQSYPILLEGIAAQIDYTVNDQGNRRIDVNDEDMWDGSYACWIPEHIPLEFGEDSPIIIIGSINKSKFNDKDQYQVNVEGIFPLPEYFEKTT